MVIITVNIQKNRSFISSRDLSCALASRSRIARLAFDRCCGFNLPRVRSFTCHRHRLVSSAQRTLSASMRHQSDAETGSRQTHGWNGGEMSRAPACRDAGCARRGHDRGGDRTEEGTGPGREQDQKKKKKCTTLMNIHTAWASSCAAYQLIKGLI